MKYAIVLPDGAADEPVESLGGRTPLEVAKKPHMDWVAASGRQGRVVTVPTGFPPGSDVATLSLFGYDPQRYHVGRAPLEAAAQGIVARPDQLIFRCNFVTIVDGVMEDFTAGHISQTEADRLIADLNEQVADEQSRFHAGLSYRNLMITSDVAGAGPKCTPPHDFPGQPAADHLPTGPGAEWTKSVMDKARELLGGHEVNAVRGELGENRATDIWLWGQGGPTKLESFESRFGIRAALVAAVGLVRGIGKCAGIELLNVPGATGYLDTDYEAKGAAAVAALDDFDMVVAHVEAPDEAGHLGDADAKIAAIECVDEHVVGPVVNKLRTFDRWKILIAPDHPTPVERKVHTAAAPPFCFAGHAVQSVLSKPFTESNAASTGLHINPGYELMEYFLKP